MKGYYKKANIQTTENKTRYFKIIKRGETGLLGLQRTELLEHSQDVRVQLGREEQVLQGHHVLLDYLVMLQTQKEAAVRKPNASNLAEHVPHSPPTLSLLRRLSFVTLQGKSGDMQ